MTTYHPHCNQHKCYHTDQNTATTPNFVKYREYRPDGTSALFILKNPSMNWEDEVQEQKDERELRRNAWKYNLLLIGGAATFIGWAYIVTHVFGY
jgi:hypothetical protein